MAIDLVGLPEAAYIKDNKENKKGEDDKSYLHNSSYIQQNHDSIRVYIRFCDINSLAITSSFYLCKFTIITTNTNKVVIKMT